MPAPAIRSPNSASQTLNELEDWLHEDYGFLISILPRSIFETRDQKIYIKEDCLPQNDPGKTLSYGPSGKAGTRLDFLLLITFSRVPPLSWIRFLPPDLLSTPIWRKRTTALVQYYLLVWASNENWSGYVDGPQPDRLRDALDKLKETRTYKQALIRRETPEIVEFHISRLGDENVRALQIAKEAGAAEQRISEHASATHGYQDVASLSTAEKSSQNSARSSSYTTGSQHQTPETMISARSASQSSAHRTTPCDHFPTTEQLARIELSDLTPNTKGFDTRVGTLMIPSLDGQADQADSLSFTSRAPAGADKKTGTPRFDSPQSHKTNEHGPKAISSLNESGSSTPAMDAPASIANEEIEDVPSDFQAPAIDEHLTNLQTRVGHNLLSLLPELRTAMFKRLHHGQDRPGYLPLRMLFGVANKLAPAQVQGSNVWVVLKIHEKDARTAPRMLLDAFNSDNDHLIQENLAFKSTLPWLDLEPVFKNVTDQGSKREHQLKAMIKYYFMLAANAKLYGFEQALMPANNNFVDQMKTLCKRIHKNDPPPRPWKRRRTALDNSDVTPCSDMDEQTPDVATFSGRPSRRSLKRPASAVDAGTEQYARSFRGTTPKVALGPFIETDAPSHMTNQFLDPDAEARDSDGDSGDELPAGVPYQHRDILLKRVQAECTVRYHNSCVNDRRKDKIRCDKAMKTLQWRASRRMLSPEAAKDKLEAEKGTALRAQGQIDYRKTAIARFKMKEMEYDATIQTMDRSVVRLWESLFAEQKQMEAKEKRREAEEERNVGVSGMDRRLQRSE